MIKNFLDNIESEIEEARLLSQLYRYEIKDNRREKYSRYMKGLKKYGKRRK